MNILLLMMGGSGTRFGAEIPKQFIQVENKPIFSYILKKYDDMEAIDKIVIVSHKDWIPYVYEWAEKLAVKKLETVVAGGDSRSSSVLNGLMAVESIAKEKDVVLIHDATHPYVDVKGTDEVISAVTEFGGATLGSLQYDTVYEMREGFIASVIPREKVVVGASPEAFQFQKIYNIYKNASEEELNKMTSAGAIALANNIPMKVVATNLINLKITYKDDMEAFKKLFYDYYF